jgi:mono/diheme cytochrome c family protein
MNCNKLHIPINSLPYWPILLVLLLIIVTDALAQKQPSLQQLEQGKLLAKKCIDCHGSNKTALADPLRGIRKIRTANYIYSLLKSPMQFADENKTAKKVFAKRGLQMPPFPDLSKAQIKLILDYLDSLPSVNAKNKITN